MGGTVSRDTVRGIEATILKTGNMRALSPGEDLIKQGVPLNSLYYISVGEMTISTTTPEGKSIVLGQRSRGDIVGELSFLLSAVPTATVGVAPDYAQQVTVIELERTRVLQLVQKDPRLASQVFQGLSMALAHRISLSSDATQAALMYDSQHMPSESHSPEASNLEEGEELPPGRFGLPSDAELVRCFAGCTVLFEDKQRRKAARWRGGRGSTRMSRLTRVTRQTQGAEQNEGFHAEEEIEALVAVFTTALAIELKAFNFVSHRIVPYDEILSCEEMDQLSESEQGSETRMLQLSCKGHTLWLNTPRKVFKMVSHEIENRRLHAVDVSVLEQTAGRESKREQAAGVIEKPLDDAMLKRIYEEQYLRLVQEGDALSGASMAEEEEEAGEAKPKTDTVRMLTELTVEEWGLLMRGAEHFVLAAGRPIIKEGARCRALYQLMEGVASVQVKIKGRPQAVVVGYKSAGDIFGERSLLMGGNAHASVVVSSEHASFVRLKGARIEKLFKSSHPELPAKFYYFLAINQAKRLRSLTEASAPKMKHEVVPLPGSSAPTTMEDFIANPACMHQLKHFIHRSEKAATNEPVLEFLMEYQGLIDGSSEVSNAATIALAAKLYRQYIDPRHAGARRLVCSTKVLRNKVEGVLKTVGHGTQTKKLNAQGSKVPSDRTTETERLDLVPVREAFGEVADIAVKYLQFNAIPDFLASPQYRYVLVLRAKEEIPCTTSDFKIVRVLVEDGRFGTIVEAIKRDCAQRYTMQIMQKALLRQEYGATWAHQVVEQRLLHTRLQHRLLTTVAYAFQTPQDLHLVLDPVCEVSLLECLRSREVFTPPQALFTAVEAVAILAYLHSQRCVCRAFHPEFLLVDSAGHLRLSSFELTVQARWSGDSQPPQCTDCKGMPGYTAPEVLATRELDVSAAARSLVGQTSKAYGVSADWWSLGCLLYEVSERKPAFDPSIESGKDPASVLQQFEQEHSAMLDGINRPRTALRELIKSLLDWNPATRLGTRGGASDVKNADLFTRERIDWRAADMRALPSPLRSFAWWKDAYRSAAIPKKGTVDVMKRESLDDSAVSSTQEVFKSDSTKEASSLDKWEYNSSKVLAQEFLAFQAAQTLLM